MDFTDLYAVADRLRATTEAQEVRDALASLGPIEAASREVGRSFSGSWQGYHSHVYYEDFRPAPPGAHFSQEWGLMDTGLSSLGSYGDWVEYDSEAVESQIRQLAAGATTEKALTVSEAAAKTFDAAKSEILSILQTELAERPDAFLEDLKKELEGLNLYSPGEIARKITPGGQVMTRDTVTIGQGTRLPPHLKSACEVDAVRHVFAICERAGTIARRSASHIERKMKRKAVSARIGTNVFIGHGRSQAWRELKDFVEGRLHLPWDEFNRVPVAGVTNTARLSEMLDAAAVALLVMTAEDEMADGEKQARMNVVHEAGLFQGRLGFSKAVVLLEAGCQEFSNINGLGQIRFPAGQVSASFEEVRRFLEREGLIAET